MIFIIYFYLAYLFVFNLIYKNVMELTQQQKLVMDRMWEFLHTDSSVFILHGYAGTGKTTLLLEFARLLLEKNIVFDVVAPTGRAAKVLNSKFVSANLNVMASTIHRAIYDLDDIYFSKDSDGDEVVNYFFPLARPAQLPQVVIVDEASMVSSMPNNQEMFQFGSGILLEDLMSFTCCEKGGKLIFVGDPAQLPPVGDSRSNALDPLYFKKKGLKVVREELKEVLRQERGSSVLLNATKIRSLLDCAVRNCFKLEEKEGEVERLEVVAFVDKYVELNKCLAVDKTAIICFSNAMALDYNKALHDRFFGSGHVLENGELLLVVNNNYRLMTPLFNGDIVKITKVIGEEEKLSAPIMAGREGERKRLIIHLKFQNVELMTDSGKVVECKVISSMVSDPNRDLSYEARKALFVNFCMRHKELKVGSSEFKLALANDPYFNAVQIKYGYAITGHKCQGGEWDAVMVDYKGRTGMSDDCLRWAYTVTTRARRSLYVGNLFDLTPFDKITINRVTKVGKSGVDTLALKNLPETPFHGISAGQHLKAKYFLVEKNLIGTPFKIACVESKPYREIYTIETEEGEKMRFDGVYKGNRVFQPFKALGCNALNENVLRLLNDESNMVYDVCYEPGNVVAEQLYVRMLSYCDELGILITNVVENLEQYKIIYYLKTSGAFAYIEFFVNKKGFVSYGNPCSDMGDADDKLKQLVEKMK